MREIVCVSSEAKRDRREVSKRKSVCEQRVSVCECACVWVRVRVCVRERERALRKGQV